MKYNLGVQWKMTDWYWGKNVHSLLGLKNTLSSSRTPSGSPILVKGSTATTCQPVSASTTLLIQTLGFATYSSWVRNISTVSKDFKIVGPSGEIVEAAGGNYSTLSVNGGVVAVHIQWICNLDFDFMENCLPRLVGWDIEGHLQIPLQVQLQAAGHFWVELSACTLS